MKQAKIAVFLPNWVGDLVMATPALRALRQHVGPAAIVVGVQRPYLDGLLDGTGWLDATWPFDPRATDPSLRSGGLIRRLRRERFDMAVLLTNSLRPAWIAYRAGIPERVGYAANGRSPLLTGACYWPRVHGRRAPFPCVDMYLRIVELFGCFCPARNLELTASDADRDAAESVFEKLGLRAERLVLLNGGGAYGASKLWPIGHFAALAREIIEKLDHDVLVLCGPKERNAARELVEQAGSPRIASMADQQLRWGLVKACISWGRAMITTDSGPRHIAAALGVPVVTLFGPTIPAWIDNPTVRGVHLTADVDCLGCYRRVCPHDHHRCMRELSVAQAFGAAVRCLELQDADPPD